jgi:hypothetical protein
VLLQSNTSLSLTTIEEIGTAKDRSRSRVVGTTKTLGIMKKKKVPQGNLKARDVFKIGQDNGMDHQALRNGVIIKKETKSF